MTIVLSLFKGFLSLIVKYWKISLPIIIVLGTMWYINSLRNDLADANQEISELTQSLNSQNEEIKKLEKDSEERLKKMQAAEITAEKIRKKYEHEIEKLKQENQPETCEGVIEWMVDKAKEDLKW